MYLIGIDIAKFSHQCFIATIHGEVINSFSFDNNSKGFELLLKNLNCLDHSLEIRIGLEATGHYGNNLKQFLSVHGYDFVEFNPYLSKQFFKSISIRKTKTDKIDAQLLSSMIASINYEAMKTKKYYVNELKILTKTRNSLIEFKSKYLVQITNALDVIFPEFKPFFNNRLGLTALYLLERFKTPEKIKNLSKFQYEHIRTKSMGKFSYPMFTKLKKLAKETIGIKSNSYTSTMVNYINLYNSVKLELKTIENQITNIMEMLNTQIITIPGISLMSAATIIAEVEDFNKFSNPAKLIAFAGLDVSIYQSGESLSHGKLVKRGSHLLRKTIWNLCLILIKLIPQFTDYYGKKKSEGKHRNVIFSSISRKILRLIHHLETTNTSFDFKKLS